MDTSGRNASIAVYDSEKQIFLAQTSIYTRLTHSQIIMPLCEDVLKKSETSLNDIDVIAVADGPGSYTGLRIGISSVKAMAFGLDCKVCGVSTLESLVYNNLSFPEIICPIMKARENLVYSAIFRKGKFIMDEKIIAVGELTQILKSYNAPVLICGDYSKEFAENSEFNIALPSTRLQNACGVCLAAADKHPIPPELLEVSYLQKVKAEKDLEKHP